MLILWKAILLVVFRKRTPNNDYHPTATSYNLADDPRRRRVLVRMTTYYLYGSRGQYASFWPQLWNKVISCHLRGLSSMSTRSKSWQHWTSHNLASPCWLSSQTWVPPHKLVHTNYYMMITYSRQMKKKQNIGLTLLTRGQRGKHTATPGRFSACYERAQQH